MPLTKLEREYVAALKQERYYETVAQRAYEATRPLTGKRAVMIGDSMLGMGCRRVTISTSANQFVVANGIATITATAHRFLPGWYVSFANLGASGTDAATYSLNGALVRVLSTPDNNTFTVSATVNGETMADGDYSNVLSGSWTMYNHHEARDSSFTRILNYRTGNRHRVIGNYAFVGALSGFIRNIIPKIVSGPAFDVFHFCAGTNDLNGGAAISEANALRNGHIAVSNITYTVQRIYDETGAHCVLYIPPPFGAGTSNELEKNKALVQMRWALLEFAASRPWIQIVDTFAAIVDGTSTTGVAQSAYIESAGVHVNMAGNYRIASFNSAAMEKTAPHTDYRPVSVLDDGSTYSQALTAWQASTAYTLVSGLTVDGTNIVVNGGNIYRLTASGTSGTTGPTGTRDEISDGTCRWAYVGPYARNIVINGLMAGTTANSGITLTGTRPTGWSLQNNANVTGTTTGQQARVAVTGSNAANYGYGFELDLTFASAQSQYALATGLTAGLVAGQWYQAGVTVNIIEDLSNIRYLYMVCDYNNGTITCNATANSPGDNNSNLPLVAGDVVELLTDPFYLPAGYTPTQALTFVYIASSAAGAARVQLANAFWKAIPNPYT